jgi:DnaJ-class molecular chaperone
MNPFYEICDNNGSELDGSLFGTAFGGLNEPKPAKMPDINVKVDLTIKEIFCGVRKEVTYERQTLGLDGRTVRQETSSVSVVVRPGIKITQ